MSPDLSVPRHPDIFVVGDTAALTDAQGVPLPGVAPVAKQQGQYVAKLLIARAAGKTVPPFRYRDFGSLATIGRKRAVVQMGRFKIRGFIAWVVPAGRRAVERAVSGNKSIHVMLEWNLLAS